MKKGNGTASRNGKYSEYRGVQLNQSWLFKIFFLFRLSLRNTGWDLKEGEEEEHGQTLDALGCTPKPLDQGSAERE